MRRIRMMIGALLAAACLVPATAFALGASGLTLASPEVREGTSDIALALRAEGDAAQNVSSVRVTLSVATAVPEDPIDLVLNSSKDDGDADGDGGSGSEGGSAGQSGDGGSGSGSGGAGSAGGSAGSNPDRGSSSDQGGSAGPLATTGDPLNSIALAIGVIAAASCAAVALAAVSLRRSAREDN